MTSPTMRAVLIETADGPLEVRKIPTPEPGHGEALVAIGGCAVDRFDLAIRKGMRERATTLPHILGHEIAGTVVAVGEGVVDVGVGDRVASTLYLVCGRCRWCRRGRETICERFGGHVGVDAPGGYAEYAVLPARNLARIPNVIPVVEASVLANAIGTPFHAIVVRMNIAPGDRLVITGAGGGVGLHAVQIGAMLGAEVLAADIGAEKLERCLAMGASATVDSTTSDLTTAIREWTAGAGADAVLELVGPATMTSTLASLAKRGKDGDRRVPHGKPVDGRPRRHLSKRMGDQRFSQRLDRRTSHGDRTRGSRADHPDHRSDRTAGGSAALPRSRRFRFGDRSRRPGSMKRRQVHAQSDLSMRWV